MQKLQKHAYKKMKKSKKRKQLKKRSQTVKSVIASDIKSPVKLDVEIKEEIEEEIKEEQVSEPDNGESVGEEKTVSNKLSKKEDDEFARMKKHEEQRAKIRAMRRRKRRIKVYTMRFLLCMVVMLFVFFCVWFGRQTVPVISEYVEETVEEWHEEKVEVVEDKPIKVWEPPEMTIDFITPNEYSRPQEALEEVNSIFVHYTANIGTSAAQNKSYFENVGITGERSVSSHFVVGFNGEIIQCLPLEEIGYAVRKRNYDSVSIECCYLDEDGKFTQATWDSLVPLLAWLISKYDLTTDDILRHYDAGGKLCPKYYVEHEDQWRQLKRDVAYYITKYGTKESPQELKEQEAEEAEKEMEKETKVTDENKTQG